MEKKNLILSDIDGTFLGKGGRIVPENRTAVELFKSKGGLFAFSSGRTEISMMKIIPDAGAIVNSPSILANGSYLFDHTTGEKIDYVPMDAKKILPDLMRIESDFPDVGVRIMRLGDYLTNALNAPILSDLRGYAFAPVVLPFKEMPLDCWSKLVCIGGHDRLLLIRDLLEKKYSGVYSFSFSSSHIFEVSDIRANKGEKVAGLKKYFENKGIDARIFAVGDYENDIGMLKAADVACCPFNALDCVKAVCAKVLCHHDKGAVAELIALIDSGYFDF